MRSRTQRGPNGTLWGWFNMGSVFHMWRIRRVTGRYVLLTPTEANTLLYDGDPHQDHKRAYVLLRWPEDKTP